MQSGYGVSEMQQLVMVDGICSSFFPVAATATTNADMSPLQKQHHNHTVHQPHPSFYHHQQQQLQYHHFNGFLKQQHQEQHPSATPPSVAAVIQHHHHQQLEQQRFQSHFQHSLPFTQQLFEQTHQFHLFNQEQQARLHNQHPPHSISLDRHHQRPSSPQNSASPPRIDVCSTGGGRIPSFFGPSMNFRLSVNDGNSDGGGTGDGLDDEDVVNGSERQWPPPPTSRGEEDSAIKEPFWRPLDLDLELDLDCINGNNKRCKEKNNHHNQQEQQEQQVDLEIPSAKRFKETINVAAEDGTNYKLFSELEAICNNNQTGSSSALTGENTQITLNDPPPIEDHNADEGVERCHHTGPMRVETTDDDGSKGVVDKERRRRRRRKKQHLSSIAAFFQTLVKQLLDHQESLNRKFLDVMEKREKERTVMEEAWKQQQATKSIMEAKERKDQQAIAAKRESTIVSFIEKITGETITLPPKPQFQSYPQEEQDYDDDNLNQEASNNTNSPNCAISSSNRWPKAEVQALIRVRSQLETRFQEPGLKGPLWEEVSSAMASMGYRRDAKRCKEKWENINKYFRKAKESTKKRPHHSKTCSYFHLLDQLYSRTPTTTAAIAATENTDVEQRGNNSELLDAIVVSKYSEMIHLNLEFGPNDLNVADEDDRQEDDDHEVEGEGESDLGATKPVHEEGMNCIQSSFQQLEHTRSMKL